MKHLLILSLLMFAGSLLMAKEYPLVKDGKAVFCIVTGGFDLNDAESYAALELADYVEKVTGARPEIRQSVKKGTYPVYIGNSFRQKMPRNVVIKLNAVKDDGYLLAGTPEGVFIWSKEPAGLIFGAYELLKRCADIRWFYPGEDGEYIRKQSSISIPDMVLVDNPRMIDRKFNHVCANIYTDQVARQWLLRNKMTSYGRFGGVRHGGGHIFSTLMPDTYFYKKPELYGLYKGKRLPQCGDPAKITATGIGGQKNQPCTSNPETLRIMKENMIRYIAKYNLNSFNIMNNDSTSWCECDNCRKLDTPYERENELVSTRFWTLANELIKAGKEVFPHVRFSTSAYQNYQVPPTGIKPDNRTSVVYCVHHRCYTQCRRYQLQNQPADPEYSGRLE